MKKFANKKGWGRVSIRLESGREILRWNLPLLTLFHWTVLLSALFMLSIVWLLSDYGNMQATDAPSGPDSLLVGSAQESMDYQLQRMDEVSSTLGQNDDRIGSLIRDGLQDEGECRSLALAAIRHRQESQKSSSAPVIVSMSDRLRYRICMDSVVDSLNFVRYYDAEMRFIPHISPLANKRLVITSPYGVRRGVLDREGESEFHRGVDLRAKRGSPVVATADGTIKEARFSRNGYGNLVMIQHPSGLFTLYAHLSTHHVRKGDVVRIGEIIGYSGATGYVTGPHLHYEIRYAKLDLDPEHYLVP